MVSLTRLLVVLLATLVPATAIKTWPVADTPTLLSVLAQVEAGDIVELEPGTYELESSVSQLAPLLLNKPLTLRSRDAIHRAVLQNNGAASLIAITSAGVTLADIVVGAQRTGPDERSIDVLIGAGTQTAPANTLVAYNGVSSSGSALQASRNEILAARGIQAARNKQRKRSVQDDSDGDEQLRALHELRITNVDFGNSLSGTNVGFAAGAYSDVRIEGCRFGRTSAGGSHVNALVSVRSALFAELTVERCSFVGGAHVLLASDTVEPADLGRNHWSDDEPLVFIGGATAAPETFCLDSACERLAP